jgi:hypothetical protein
VRKFLYYLIIIYYLLITASLAITEIENLKNLIILKGATPLIKIDVDDDKSYKNLLKTQYEFILKEEVKIIKDIKIAENSCKIMGYNPGYTKKNKKKFNTCVLEVWQARLIGKKFVSMQSEIDTRKLDADELQKYFNTKLDAFNKVRNIQLKKNKKFKERFKELGVKDKLEEVDYQKIVVYAIGIIAVYYVGKTILDSLDEAKAAKDIAQSGTSNTAKIVNQQRNVSYCNYGKMLYGRYGIRHGALVYCSR